MITIPPVPVPVRLRRHPYIDVRDFGFTDATGGANSTAAFVAALTYAATIQGTVRVPAGTFLVDPETLNGNGAGLKGERKAASGGTVLKTSGAGDWLFEATTQSRIDEIQFDCDDVVTDGVIGIAADVTWQGSVIDATRYGWSLRKCTGKIDVHTSGNGSHGVYLSSCKELVVESIGSFGNVGFGFLVDGEFRDSAAGDDNEGTLIIKIAQCESNTAGVAWFDGVEGLALWALRAEGGGDCLLIEDCHNCTFRNVTMAGGAADTTRMVRIITSANIHLSGVHNQNGSGSEASSYFKIRHSPDAAANPGFLKENCKYMTNVGSFVMGEEDDP